MRKKFNFQAVARSEFRLNITQVKKSWRSFEYPSVKMNGASNQCTYHPIEDYHEGLGNDDN